MVFVQWRYFYTWKIPACELEKCTAEGERLQSAVLSSLCGFRTYFTLESCDDSDSGNRRRFTLRSHALIDDPEISGKLRQRFLLRYETIVKLEVIGSGDRPLLEPPSQRECGVFEGRAAFVFAYNEDEASLDLASMEAVRVSESNASNTFPSSVLFEVVLDVAEHADVTLNGGDGCFGAREDALSDASPVLAAMFRQDTSECPERVLDIVEVDPEVLHKFLKYVHDPGTLDLRQVDTAMELYALADKYQVKALKDACASYIAKNMTPKNAFRILEFVGQFEDFVLKPVAHAEVSSVLWTCLSLIFLSSMIFPLMLILCGLALVVTFLNRVIQPPFTSANNVTAPEIPDEIN